MPPSPVPPSNGVQMPAALTSWLRAAEGVRDTCLNLNEPFVGLQTRIDEQQKRLERLSAAMYR